MKKLYTTYNIAAHWIDGGLVLCNNIAEVDESIFDNMRFDYYDEETDTYTEIFQWYLTNYTENEVEYLEETFGLLFTYSDKLDCFVLCVDHFGTMWRGVPCEVKSEDWARCNKNLLITDENKEPEFKTQRTY